MNLTEEHSMKKNDPHRDSEMADLSRSYESKYLELTFTENAIMLIEDILNRMPEQIQIILKEIYINGSTYRKIAPVYGYSDHGLWKMLKRETEKYL